MHAGGQRFESVILHKTLIGGRKLKFYNKYKPDGFVSRADQLMRVNWFTYKLKVERLILQY